MKLATPKGSADSISRIYKELSAEGLADDVEVFVRITFGELEVIEDMCQWYVNDSIERRLRMATEILSGLVIRAQYPTPDEMALEALEYADALIRLAVGRSA